MRLIIMGELINHNSALIVAVLVWGAAAVYFRRGGFARQDFLKLVVVTILIVSVYLGVRPGAGSENNALAIQAQIGQGTPVLFELQSRY